MGKLSDQVPELHSRMKLAARKHNIVDFAQALGILNQYNKPILAKIVAAKVPVIIITNENINKQTVLSVDEIKGALSHAVAFYAFGSKGFKTFGLIYLSTMRSSMIGFVNWVVPFNMDLFDGLEGTLMHEAIHAYLNLVGYNDHNRNLRQQIIDLWEIIWQQQDKFDKQESRVFRVSYYGEHMPLSVKTSNIEEIVCWCTYPVTRHMLRKVKMPVAEGIDPANAQNAFDYLMDILAEYDKERLVVNYLRKDKLAKQELEAQALLQLLKLRAAAGTMKFDQGGNTDTITETQKTDVMSIHDSTNLHRYDAVKAKYPNSIVLLNVGRTRDVYETYRDDAVDVAAIFSLELFDEAGIPFIRFESRGTIEKELQNDGQSVVVINCKPEPIAKPNMLDTIQSKPDFKNKELLVKAFTKLKEY